MLSHCLQVHFLEPCRNGFMFTFLSHSLQFIVLFALYTCCSQVNLSPCLQIDFPVALQVHFRVALCAGSEAVSAFPHEQLGGEQMSFTHSLPRSYGASSPSFSRFSPVAMVEDAQAVRCTAFHPLGTWVAFGCNSRTLRIAEWPAAPQTPPLQMLQQPPLAKQVLAKQKHHKGSIYCIAWSAGGELIATGTASTI